MKVLTRTDYECNPAQKRRATIQTTFAGSLVRCECWSVNAKGKGVWRETASRRFEGELGSEQHAILFALDWLAGSLPDDFFSR